MAESAWTQSRTRLKANFCDMCGCLLDLGTSDGYLACDMCGHRVLMDSLSVQEIVSRSTKKTRRQLQRRAEKQRLARRERRQLANGVEEEDDDDQEPKRAMVDQECPKCGEIGLYFYTMQLRSADEGQTVFYDCPNCKHTFNENS